MSDRIKYDFGGLAMLSDQMKQQAKAINDKQGDIKVVVDKLQAGWEGAGSEAWNDAQRRWGPGFRRTEHGSRADRRSDGERLGEDAGS